MAGLVGRKERKEKKYIYIYGWNLFLSVVVGMLIYIYVAGNPSSPLAGSFSPNVAVLVDTSLLRAANLTACTAADGIAGLVATFRRSADAGADMLVCVGLL